MSRFHFVRLREHKSDAARSTYRRAPLRLLAALMLCASTGLLAQTPVRRLTTVDALRQFPGYFHLQNVLVRGEFVERGTELVFRADDHDIDLLNPSQARKGPVEVRGQLIDVGRLERGDSRLGTYTERRGSAEPWPQPGAELLLNVTAVIEAQLASRPTVRAVALEPWKFAGQKVTLVGNFRGRNLFGDLPEAPGKSRYDFVLLGSEGAIWITGVRPRGRGFDLDVERRRDSNQWLQVTGVVARDRGLVSITGAEIMLASAPAIESTTAETAAPAAPPAPTAVVFSAPTADDTDVSPTAPVRIGPHAAYGESSLAGRVRVTYLGAEASDPPIDFKVSYDTATRAVQITFARPLEPFRTVKVELLEGIAAFDGGPSVPWTLIFSVGSR